MAISSTVKKATPYVKMAGEYVKTMLSSRNVKMDSGYDLETELKNKFRLGGWTNLSSKIGLTTLYRTNGYLTEVAVFGFLNNVYFSPNSGYTLATLPVNARPSYAHRIQTTDSRLYVEITNLGVISINSWTDVTNTTSEIRICQLIATMA